MELNGYTNWDTAQYNAHEIILEILDFDTKAF